VRLPKLSLIADIVEAGSRDPIFDALLVAGPVVIALIALLGQFGNRSPVAVALAGGYLGAFLAAVAYRWLGACPDERGS